MTTNVTTAPSSEVATDIIKAIAGGRSLREVSDGLVTHNVADAATARTWVRELATAVAEARAKAASKRMLYGALWCGGGTAVTYFTYVSASAGGSYFVAWGAIAFGAFDILRGLFGWMKARSLKASAATF